jgi:hypothetical protein
MSTQADDKEPSTGSSWTTNVSCGETDDPIMSFQALSLQHSQPAMEDKRPRWRFISDDDVDASAATAPGTKENGSASSWFPLVRKVSLEPKTQTPIDFEAPIALATKSILDNIPSTSTCGKEQRQKRWRDVNVTYLPCLDEQTTAHTRKRRRLASRNKALDATGFDQILSQIGFVGGAV